MPISEGTPVTVECLDTGIVTDAMVVTKSLQQVRVNLSGIPMTFRKQPNGQFSTAHAGMQFVLRDG